MDAKTSTVVLLGSSTWLNVFQVLFRVKQLFKSRQLLLFWTCWTFNMNWSGATSDTPHAPSSTPLAVEGRPHSAFPWRGMQCTWNRLSQGWEHSLPWTSQREAPEHLPCIAGIVCGVTQRVSVCSKAHIPHKVTRAIQMTLPPTPATPWCFWLQKSIEILSQNKTKSGV